MMKQIEAEANDTRLPKVTAFKSKDSVDYKSKKILKITLWRQEELFQVD